MSPTKIRVFMDYKSLCGMNRESARLIETETIKNTHRK